MSGIWLPLTELISTTSEIIGQKSGLALTRDELKGFVPDDYDDLWFGPDETIRRHSFEEANHRHGIRKALYSPTKIHPWPISYYQLWEPLLNLKER